jgi:hypothetical protein
MQNNIINKVRRRLWNDLVGKTKKSNFYPLLYISFWHYYIYGSNKKTNQNSYYTTVPNMGAGIGHQIANWIAGYWFAKQFDLQFAHNPFSTTKWENFLGFGEGEVDCFEIIKQGYKKVRLPLFNERNTKEVALQKKIIASYTTKKVIFIAEQDQFYRDQFGVLSQMQQKFYNAPSRKKDKLHYDENAYNIAIHVRRGDIVAGQGEIENHSMRWLTNDYFVTVLQNTLNYITTDKKVAIYLFSQGKKGDFIEFEKFPNLIYCLDMSAMDSFLHMVYADLLITSKSSFSYKPALINKGIKIVPENFWHGYPNTNDWIMADQQGNLKNL